MHRIQPVIKDYAWGSRVALAQLAGREQPSATPEAELWVGAHEAGPARVDLGDGHFCGLDEHIAGDDERHLGIGSLDAFGRRLPFLLKILAADRALSIQAHPDAARAASAPEGVYGDSWAKPEAWVPLTECEAFAGSLPFDEASALLVGLDVPALTDLVDQPRGAADPAHALLAALLHVPADDRAEFVAAVVAAVRALVDAGSADEATARALSTVLDVHEQFPGDVGVVVLLTMRHLVMTPGRSYFIGAGVLHSFVHGTTIEVLANSDNVVRGGLTPKETNVEELLTIVDVRTPVEAQEPRRLGDGDGSTLHHPTAAPHFELFEVRPNETPTALPIGGAPAVMLALDAPVTVRCGDEAIRLERLECVWSSASDPDAVVTGVPGSRLFVASVDI